MCKAGGKYGTLGSALQAEQDNLRDEESALVQLEDDVGRTKGVADAIATEVDDQSALLDRLEAGVAALRESNLLAASLVPSLDDHSLYSPKYFCRLLAPAVLISVIVILGVRHLVLPR